MFKEMSYVYAVYQETSFTKAAQKLYLSQPALSAMVKKAEKKKPEKKNPAKKKPKAEFF